MADVQAAPAATADTGSTANEGNPADGIPAEIPEWKKQKHKYKAAGQEYEVDYDELVKRAEKGHGAEKKFADASKIEKEMKSRLEKLKDPQSEDFDELINLIGFEKAKKFADKLVWEQIQWDELTDHEKKARIAQQRADEAESKLKSYEEKQQGSEKALMSQQAMQVIDTEIKQVLEAGRKEGLSVADIPEATELIIDEMLAYLEYCDEQDKDGKPIRQAPPSHRDVLQKIQEREDLRSSANIKRLSVEQLRKVLTKEQLSQLRQSEIDQLYAPTQPAGRSTKQTIENNDSRPSAKKKVMSTNDYFKNLDSKYGV